MMKQLAAIFFLLALALVACQEVSSTPTVTTEPGALRVTGEPTLAPTAAPATGNASSHTVTPSSAAPATASTTATAPATPSPTRGVQGALIYVTMRSQVGVLLDEFPESMRERVADALLAEGTDEWIARAQRQVRLTRLRLNFRDSHQPGKGPLPLPRPEEWSFAVDEGGPSRQTIQGHDLFLLDYTFSTTILSDADSVAESEPELAQAGGVWEEQFRFPADPDLLLQRTGRACINDNGFPPNSVDSENVWYFYDSTRTTCEEVLAVRVGVVETTLRFHRLVWDATLADRVRSGPVTTRGAADLQVVGEDLSVNRLVYRYVEPGDCALQEGVVEGGGWRRLLLFNATVYNVGDLPLHIGEVAANARDHNIFTFADCHDHFHYQHYGDFTLRNEQQLTTSKQAFCVQSTDRWSNNELSPLMHSYSCRFQGIQAGWVDEYMAGLATQWVDVTELDVPQEGKTVQLGFSSNQDGFLCEGAPLLDEEGQPLWEPSGFSTEDGEPINRPRCDFFDGWQENNDAVRNLFLPAEGSFVTAACASGEVGPLRNCGFSELTVDGVQTACRAQQPLQLNLQVSDEGAPQVVRVCERSAVLGTGVACSYEDALANEVVGQQSTPVSFTCPFVRDAAQAGRQTPGANYALYAAPLWPEDGAAPIELSE